MGITGVPFGRTELSIGASGRKCCALLRREGPVGPSVQWMPEKFDVHFGFSRSNKSQTAQGQTN